MSDDNFEGPEAPITVTLKGGAGFEAPWLVFRATSAEDAIALLAESALADLPEKVAEFAADFRAKQSGGGGAAKAEAPARGAQRSSSGGRTASRPAPQAPADDVEYHPEGIECPSCNSPVQYKAINKGSRKFELWTCPNQRSKGDGHYSEFI